MSEMEFGCCSHRRRPNKTKNNLHILMRKCCSAYQKLKRCLHYFKLCKCLCLYYSYNPLISCLNTPHFPRFFELLPPLYDRSSSMMGAGMEDYWHRSLRFLSLCNQARRRRWCEVKPTDDVILGYFKTTYIYI